MSDEAAQEDKTEDPSAQRLSKAREEGRVAKSTDLAAAVMLLAAGLATYVMLKAGGSLVGALREMWTRLHEADQWVSQPGAFLAAVTVPTVKALFPMLVVLSIAALSSHMMQTGPLLSWKALEPKFNKLNPLTGVKRVFAPKELSFNIIKTLLKVAFVGIVAISTILYEGAELFSMVRYSPAYFSAYLQDVAVWTLTSCGLSMIILGGLDFAWQHHKTTKQMRMTKEEVKREHKENEGDPHQKGRRAQKHRELLSMNSIMDAVPDADVVINNPTHISVALRYRTEDGAPVVVAMGTDAMALKIREIAKDNKVPMLTNIPLARALHKSASVGDHIPDDLFKAVAEVLVFVWRQHGRRQR